MRLIKTSGLVLLVATAAMVLVNPFAALSQADGEDDTEIVLCKIGSEDLCPVNSVWGTGKLVESYPETKYVFLSATLETTCGKGLLIGRIRPKMAPTLTWTTTQAKIEECSGACKKVTVQGLPVGKTTVNPVDAYFLLLPLTLKFECVFSLTCIYSADLVMPIADPNIGGIPQAVVEDQVLTRQAGSNAFCPMTIKMDGRLVLNGLTLTVLFSLFQLTEEQQELQPAEEAHEEELLKEEWHQEELEL